MLFADAQLRLLDAQFLALDGGIPKIGLLLLLLLVLLSTTNVALSLDLQAEIRSALLLDRQIYSANGQLRGSELKQLSRAHGGFRAARLNRPARGRVLRVERVKCGALLGI